jgi:DegV family protein with EDD domain
MRRYDEATFPSSPWLQSTPHVRIVTDSTATILPSHAQALGILVVPNRIIVQGRVYRDGVDINAAEFYRQFPRIGRSVVTEPASAEDLYSTYQWAFSQGATAIVSIHASRRVSLVYSHAQAAREALTPAPIDVIDSQFVGVGMWPAVIRAARLASTGASPQAILDGVATVLARTRLYALLESLDYMRRGGRSPRAVQLFGRALNAYPILSYQNGEVVPVDNVRTRPRAVQRMCQLAFGQGAVEEMLVCGTSVEWIAQMEAALAQQYHGTIQKTWLSPTIGVHTGPSVSIGVVYARSSDN